MKKKTENLLTIILYVLNFVVWFIAYRLGRRRTRREREEDRLAAEARERDRRVDQVVQDFAQLVNSGRTGGLHGFLTAGAKNLLSSEEIRLARERATNQTARDPLRQYSVEDAKLKEFIAAADWDTLSVKNDRELRERFCKK